MSTGVTSEKCCQDRKVCQVSSFRAAKRKGWKGCQEQEMSTKGKPETGSKESANIRKGCQENGRSRGKRRPNKGMARMSFGKGLSSLSGMLMEMRYALVK